MEYFEKIARVLRADRDTIKDIERQLGLLTGKRGVMDQIGRENEERMSARLAQLEIPNVTTARKIYNALIERIAKDNASMARAMGNPECGTFEGCTVINEHLLTLSPRKKGFFLKKECFVELLEKEPPKKIMEVLGYTSVSEMFAKEDWREIAAGIRFVEGIPWINNTLLPHYAKLTPGDFEERDIELIAISEKWQKAAERFVRKKYHNISHLKELGIIFIIPTRLHFEGELIRTVALLSHYLNEVPFYSDLFARAAEMDAFSERLVSLLRGDIRDEKGALGEGDWLVVQRYLAKDDENDWRLFVPHVDPEALHWERAEHILSQLGEHLGIKDLAFWEDLNWVGDYFPTNTGIEVLVSFNLVDTAMSLVQKKEMIKYLYHHQEALWNKIFSSYVGEETMEELIKLTIVEGIITKKHIEDAIASSRN